MVNQLFNLLIILIKQVLVLNVREAESLFTGPVTADFRAAISCEYSVAPVDWESQGHTIVQHRNRLRPTMSMLPINTNPIYIPFMPWAIVVFVLDTS